MNSNDELLSCTCPWISEKSRVPSLIRDQDHRICWVKDEPSRHSLNSMELQDCLPALSATSELISSWACGVEGTGDGGKDRSDAEPCCASTEDPIAHSRTLTPRTQATSAQEETKKQHTHTYIKHKKQLLHTQNTKHPKRKRRRNSPKLSERSCRRDVEPSGQVEDLPIGPDRADLDGIPIARGNLVHEQVHRGLRQEPLALQRLQAVSTSIEDSALVRVQPQASISGPRNGRMGRGRRGPQISWSNAALDSRGLEINHCPAWAVSASLPACCCCCIRAAGRGYRACPPSGCLDPQRAVIFACGRRRWRPAASLPTGEGRTGSCTPRSCSACGLSDPGS
eukprot:scaffold1366_cov233-Pinguiococcus_pyrenoidosus.AAC.7